MTCGATGFDCRGRCNQDRVSIPLPSPPEQGSSNTSRLTLSRLWLIRGAHQPRRRRSPKPRTALSRCHSGAQRKATLPSASHQLIYKNYRCSYRRVCSGLLVLGAALLCLFWGTNRGGKGKTGKHLSLSQAEVVPRRVLLGSASQMEKIPYDSDYKEILVYYALEIPPCLRC